MHQYLSNVQAKSTMEINNYIRQQKNSLVDPAYNG